MKKAKKRLALLLCALMILSMLPAFAFAEGEGTPEVTEEYTPTPTPEVTPTPTPEVTPTASPEVSPAASPEVSPAASPEVSPAASPEVSPAASPEVSPATSPEVTPTASPAPTPADETVTVYVLLPTDESIELSFMCSEPVAAAADAARDACGEIFGLHPSQVSLTLDGQPVNEEMTLGEYGVQNGDVFAVAVSGDFNTDNYAGLSIGIATECFFIGDYAEVPYAGSYSFTGTGGEITTYSYYIPAGCTLTLSGTVTLNVSEDDLLVNCGTVVNNAAIVNNGAVYNGGTIVNNNLITNNGILQNGGEIGGIDYTAQGGPEGESGGSAYIENNGTIENNGEIINYGLFGSAEGAAVTGAGLFSGASTYVNIEYVDEYGNKCLKNDANPIAADTEELTEGWYYVSEAYSNATLKITGKVNIILTDKSFSVGAFNLSAGASLSIYGSETGSAGSALAVSSLATGSEAKAALNLMSGAMSIGGTVNGVVDIKVLNGRLNLSSGIIGGSLTLGTNASAQFSGGSFKSISAAKPLSEYLADGYLYKAGGLFVTDTSVTALDGGEDYVSVRSVPFTITTQPANVTINKGETAELSVAVNAVTGNTPTYQWYKDDAVITGAQSASYTTPADLDVGSHTYHCEVACDGYSVKSSEATVTVRPAVPSGVTGGRECINGVNDTMEYRASGETDFTPVADGENSITNLPMGEYEVRYESVEGVPASGTVQVKVFDAEGKFTETKTNADGSTETTVILDDGTKTVTTVSSDGKTTTSKQYDKDGNLTLTTKTVTNADGSSVKTETLPDGTERITKYDKDGKITERITYNPDGSYVKDGYTPTLIEGDGAVYNHSRIVFRSDDEFINFICFVVDGRVVDASYYTVASGSIKVTAYTSLFRRLSAGEHTVAIVSTNGAAEGTFTVPARAGVGTGDSSNILLFGGILLLSAAGIAGIVIYLRKKKK